MKTFKDRQSREWKIDLPYGTVMRMKNADPPFNLLDPSAPVDGVDDPKESQLQIQLYKDHGLFWEMLWILIEPQATKADVSAEDFGEAMAGECLFEAKKLFFDEWRDFFLATQDHDKAAALGKTIQYFETLRKIVKEELEKNPLTEIDTMVEHEMRTRLSGRLSRLPDTLAATLKTIPGDS